MSISPSVFYSKANISGLHIVLVIIHVSYFSFEVVSSVVSFVSEYFETGPL